MKKIQIIPAILPKSLGDLEEKLNLLKEAYRILNNNEKMMVQIDICSNELFELFNFSVVQKYLDIFDFELDLMGINIGKITERLNELSHSDFDRIIFHYEDWGEKFLNLKFENFSPDIGLAITPNTLTEEINPYLNKINFVQFMGIDNVGVQGASFNPEVIKKITELKNKNFEITISVDGGVNLTNIQNLIEAGGDRFAIGSAIFGNNNSAQQIAENINQFKNIKI